MLGLNGLVPAPLTFDAPKIHSAIEQIATAIRARHASDSNLCLIGITNGGIELNLRLAKLLGGKIPIGELDPSFHRDDIQQNPIPKETRPSIIPFDVTDLTVILVDDVLFSGRTLNAALNELFDHGRPAAVELAVLVDRGGRKLPFAADYVGLTIVAGPEKKVVVTLDPAKPSADTIEISKSRK
jgi:pyrimidine operon attenuation protein/uracil phosphoribosyltransferase